jgi:hypothetical protein
VLGKRYPFMAPPITTPVRALIRQLLF